MKKSFIKRFDLTKLTNNAHLEFARRILAIFSKLAGEIEFIAVFIASMLEWTDNEDEAIDQVRKSEITKQIEDLDHQRVKVFRGIRETVQTAFKHVSSEMREAAERLNIVIKTFKNIPQLDLHGRSSSIQNFLEALETRKDDIETLKLIDWCEALNTLNEDVRALILKRGSELSARTPYRVKDCRKKVNEAYGDAVTMLESAAIMQGEEPFAELFSEMNVCADEYHRLLLRGGNKNGSTTPLLDVSAGK